MSGEAWDEPLRRALADALGAPPPWRAASPGVRAWLRALWERGSAHGASLLDVLLEDAYAAGRHVVGPHEADDVLAAFERAGWLYRHPTPSPTPSQRAGVGVEYHGNRAGYRAGARCHASHWGWWPVRTSPGLAAVLGVRPWRSQVRPPDGEVAS